MQAAFDHNQTVLSRKAAIEAAGYRKRLQSTRFLPTLSTFYGYEHKSEKDYLWPDFPVSTHENYEWRTSIEQKVFEGFARSNSLKAARMVQSLAQTALEIEKQDIALAVKTAYFNILKAQRAYAATKRAMNSIRKHLSVARALYNVGSVPGHDLLEAELRFANTQNDFIQVQNELASARTKFNMILGRPLSSSFQIADILTYTPVAETADSYIATALDQRLELKSIDLTLKLTHLEAKIAQSAYYPNISVRADYIREGDDPYVTGSDFHKTDYWEAFAWVEWDLWPWAPVRNQVREKHSIQKQLRYQRKDTASRIRLEIRAALVTLTGVEHKLPSAEKAVRLAEENLRTQELRYQIQIGTSTKVLDAQALLTEAQRNYYNALYDHNLAKAQLTRALGEY